MSFMTLKDFMDQKGLYHRSDGRIEWQCKHSIGHTVWHPEGSDSIHGCDGCCHTKEFKEIMKGIKRFKI